MKIAAKESNFIKVSSQKLFFIISALEQLGIDHSNVFDRELIASIKELKKTVSLVDIEKVYRNVLALNIQGLGLEIGKRISAKYYGLFGCTMLCRETCEEALHYAVKYHHLTTRTVRIYFDEVPSGNTVFCCEDILGQPDLYEFNLELQVSIHITLFREFCGDENLSPVNVYMESPEPENADAYKELFKCPVLFDQSFTGLEFTDEQIKLELPKHNPLAIPLLLKGCDEEMKAYLKDNELLQSVYNWVSENIHNQLLAEDLAASLCLTPRTLRRKLLSYDTSFSKICSEIKCQFAKDYCAETKLSFDDIALSIGFTETANFRKAFKQWTNYTPTEYRKSFQKA